MFVPSRKYYLNLIQVQEMEEPERKNIILQYFKHLINKILNLF